MKCPKCGEEMLLKKHGTASNPDNNNKEYDRVLFVCEADDIWITVESPKES